MCKARISIVAALLSLLPVAICAQQGSSSSEPLEFSEVVQIPDISPQELYTRAKVWFAEAFIDSKHVLEVEDKAEGLLVGKGSFPYEPSTVRWKPILRGEIVFTIKLMVKSGRYKCVLRDFRHHGTAMIIRGLGSSGPLDFGLITTDSTPPSIKGTTENQRQMVWEHLKQVSSTEASRLFLSLKTGMTKDSKESATW